MLCNPSPKKQVLSSCTKLDRVLNPSRSTKLWASFFFFSFLTSTGGLSWVQDSDYRRCKANRGPAFRVERFSAARRQWKADGFAGKKQQKTTKKRLMFDYNYAIWPWINPHPPQHNAITTSLLDFVPDKNGVWAGNKGGFKKKKGGKIQDWRTDDPTAVLFRGKSQKKTHNVRLIKTHRTLFFIYFFGFYQLGWDPQSSPTKLGRLDLY